MAGAVKTEIRHRHPSLRPVRTGLQVKTASLELIDDCALHARARYSCRGSAQGKGSAGYTLLEMLGVLAIVLLLSAVVAENVVTRIRNANADAEGVSITTLANAVQTSVVRSKSLPAATNWAQAAASYLSLPINKVTATASGIQRLFLADPAFRAGTNSLQQLPYVQTAAGSIAPISPRVMIVSSLATALPAITLNSTTFSNIWHTPPNGVPVDWPSAWANKGQDLRIVRLDLVGLFHRVVLENLDLNYAAPFSIETTNTLTSVPVGGRKEMWLIDTTVFNFHFTDNTLQAREQIVGDVSYTFENGRWRRYVLYGPGLSAGWFGQMVDAFLAAPPPPGMTRRYSNQQWVVDAMYTFLYNFGEWSLDSFSGGAPWPHIPAYEQAYAGASGLSSYSSDLLSYTQ